MTHGLLLLLIVCFNLPFAYYLAARCESFLTPWLVVIPLAAFEIFLLSVVP